MRSRRYKTRKRARRNTGLGDTVKQTFDGIASTIEKAKQRAISTGDKVVSWGTGGLVAAAAFYLPGKIAPQTTGLTLAVYTGIAGAVMVGLVGAVLPRYVPAAAVGVGLAVGAKSLAQLASRPAPVAGFLERSYR